MRIIVEINFSGYSAHFEEKPDHIYIGKTQKEAVANLLMNSTSLLELQVNWLR